MLTKSKLYLFIKNFKNILYGSLLYQWNCISFTKNMSNSIPDFSTVIKISISLIPKHPRNICPSSKHNTNQNRITFQPDISKPHLLSFFHSMYNSINLNFKGRRERSNKFSHTPRKIPSQVARPGYPLAAPSPISVNFNSV